MRLIPDGDVSGALLAVSPDRPVDLLWGIGGTPEGVISAAALKCYGGGLIGRLAPRDDARAPGGRSTPATTSTACSRRTTSCRATTASSRATGVTDGDVLAGRPLRGLARGEHRVAGHAQPLGHGAAHPVAPRPREAAPAHRPLRMNRTTRPRRRRRTRRRSADDDRPRRVADVDRLLVRRRRSARRPTSRARGGRASAGTRA